MVVTPNNLIRRNYIYIIYLYLFFYCTLNISKDILTVHKIDDQGLVNDLREVINLYKSGSNEKIASKVEIIFENRS